MYFTEIGFLHRLAKLIHKARPAEAGELGFPSLLSQGQAWPRVDGAGGPEDFSKEGGTMNENSRSAGAQLIMLQGADCRKILQNVVAKRTPAIMSYLSRDKWHVAKILLTSLCEDKLNVEVVGWMKSPRPINIQPSQPVGISFKHGYGKFVFDTTVAAFGPSADPTGGGTIILVVPDRVGVVQRRSYFRVSVPESLKVNVVFWHRGSKLQAKDTSGQGRVWAPTEPRHYFVGRLVDISAGGAQVMVPLTSAGLDQSQIDPALASKIKIEDFRKGQFVGLRFTPMPYEMPLMFNAQIRNVLPAADQKSVFLGLQIVGLEASLEGRQVLSKLVDVVERYHQINQSSDKQPANGVQAPCLAAVNS